MEFVRSRDGHCGFRRSPRNKLVDPSRHIKTEIGKEAEDCTITPEKNDLDRESLDYTDDSRGDEACTADRDDSAKVSLAMVKYKTTSAPHNLSLSYRNNSEDNERSREPANYQSTRGGNEIDEADHDDSDSVRAMTNRSRNHSTSRYDHFGLDGRPNFRRDGEFKMLRSHVRPLTRMIKFDPWTYNFDIEPAAVALDIIVIGFHFSLRELSMAARAKAITELLVDPMLGYEAQSYTSAEVNTETYLDWLAHDRNGLRTFWALQRDPNKSGERVYEAEGWHHWNLVMDFEDRSGLWALRLKLIINRRCTNQRYYRSGTHEL